MKREVVEGLQTQGTNEAIAYTVTTTPWGSAPSAPVFTLMDRGSTPWVNVTASKASGSPSVVGDVVTTPLVAGLVEGGQYRAFVRFICKGNTLECFFDILGER